MVLTGGLMESGGAVLEVKFLPRCPIGSSGYVTPKLIGIICLIFPLFFAFLASARETNQ